MPTEIIATKGAPDANSYATVQEFNDYFEDAFGAEDYWEISTKDKTRLLLTATKQIEKLTASYGKLSAAQALMFPMEWISPDGFGNAKEATILQAFYIFRHHETLVEAANNSIQGVTSESVSGSSKSISGFSWIKKWNPESLALLVPYIEIVPKLYRG